MGCNSHYARMKYLEAHPRKMSDAELLQFEKRVNTFKNKFLLLWGSGEILTPDEKTRLKKLHALKKVQQQAPPSKPANATSNKVEQSIWTQKSQKKK